MIRLKLTSSARCAVFALSFTPNVSIFDGALAVFSSEKSDEVPALAFPFDGNFMPLCDGDGLRTIAPPGTSACLSVNNNGSLTCNSGGCCTITFGRLWDRFKCWFYIRIYTLSRVHTAERKKERFEIKDITQWVTSCKNKRNKKCSNHATIFTGERSELANDFMFEIWWCVGIDGAFVFDDGKFTPDDNGTDTTKLTDVAGWCTLSEWFHMQTKCQFKISPRFNRIESDHLNKSSHLNRFIDLPSLCFTIFCCVFPAATCWFCTDSGSAHFCWKKNLNKYSPQIVNDSVVWRQLILLLLFLLTFFVSLILMSPFSYANGTNVTETSFIPSLLNGARVFMKNQSQTIHVVRLRPMWFA